jgi:hypothetical protein
MVREDSNHGGAIAETENSISVEWFVGTRTIAQMPLNMFENYFLKI